MRSRLAPSPTGALHLGNARTFLLTWLHVRAAGGTLLLRIDDLDGPRVKTGAARAAVDDLRWLGLDWDEGEGVLVQSERGAAYEAALARLADMGLVYPCVCSRSEVASAASAPHGPEGPPYPGTCRGKWRTAEEATAATGRPAALRGQLSLLHLRAASGEVKAVPDLLYGAQTFDVAADTGDFVVRKASGTAAYQLATVVDDAASGVDLVMRGADLLPSTARQILLIDALGYPRPQWLHLPLVVGPDGLRLAKRHGDTSLRGLERQGWSAERIVGWLAWSAGLLPPRSEASPRDLIRAWDPDRISRETVVAGAPLGWDGRSG
ncbi:MAG: Glutamate--tRNA ligase 1 [Planctomycetes bacterium]|nr:Glutamate--tRNA ligase 1 [Planctomycetota bacterium]